MKRIITLLITSCLLFSQGVVFAVKNDTYDVQIKKSKNTPDKMFTLQPYWESYNDELLNGYIQDALENNFDIKIATNRVRESEALLGTINAQRLPQLSFNPSIYPFKTISRSGFSITVTCLMTLDTGLDTSDKRESVIDFAFSISSGITEAISFINVI